ncbi:MAG: nucleotidyltransferase family protein [Candidatus Aminicenantes bacterium]|nr:nucleotidyltransferase family protein [Candidatus Aminicenantes bacterium]
MSDEFLVLCSRLNRTERERALLRGLLDDGPDWPRIIRRAAEDGVILLVYRALKEFGDLIPREVLDELRPYYYRGTARYLRLRNSLGAAVLELAGRGFRFAFTKGIRLAESVYGDFALRPFTDVDLLVHPGDGAGIEAALAELGFKIDPFAAAKPRRSRRGRKATLLYSAPLEGMGLSGLRVNPEQAPAFMPGIRGVDAGGGGWTGGRGETTRPPDLLALFQERRSPPRSPL